MARKSMRPGGGGRFKALTDKLEREGKSDDSARAIASTAGRAKYGAKRMSRMAARGRKRS